MLNGVYLDHNATSPLRPNVAAAMGEAMNACGNPSSVHGYGRAARRTVEGAREKLASRIGALPQQIIFTSGGTEANNTAILCSNRKRILVSAVEHDSVRLLRKDMELIPVDGDGVVRLDSLEAMLQRNAEPALVSVMLANNETGAIQPVAKVAEIAKKYGALTHSDAVQAFGKMNFNFSELGVDMMTLSAHKAGGPQGIGALVFTDHVALSALLLGGGQERSRRSGTENTVAIAGFGALAECDFDAEIARMEKLRLMLEKNLAGKVSVAAQSVARLPNTVCLSGPQMRSEMQVMRLDMHHIAVSAGSACSSGKVKASHVLLAMGYSAEESSSALRVSAGWNTTEQDIERFCGAYAGLLGAPAIQKQAA